MGGRLGKGGKKQQSPQLEPPEGANPFIPDNRKCTDLLCSLLFIVFWIGMIIIASIGLKHGEPRRLVYGTDWRGRTCGVKSGPVGDIPAYDLTSYPYLLYPRLSEDLLALQHGGYGGTQAPVATSSSRFGSLLDTSLLQSLYGICVQGCPKLEDYSGPLYVHAYKNVDTYVEPINGESKAAGKDIEDVAAGSPWRIYTDTTEVIYRCVELTKITVKKYARCVDDCTSWEVNNYNISSGETITCGADEIANPMLDCGEENCNDMILALRPNCTSVETSTTQKQISSSRSNPIMEMLSKKWFMVARWVGDLQKSGFLILLCGGVFAALLGVLWLVMLRYWAGLFVWFVILVVLIMQCIITIFCAYQGGFLTSDRVASVLEQMGLPTTSTNAVMEKTTSYVTTAGWQASQEKVKYWGYTYYTMLVLDAAIIVILVFMCSRIRIAIGIIREASKALITLPFLTLFPIIPTIFLVVLFIYWLIMAAYIGTAATIKMQDVADKATNTLGRPPIQAQVDNDTTVNYLLTYHLFGLLWTNQFIQAIAYTTVAGTFCEYYWTLDKRTIRGRPVARSFWRVVRFHLGSMACGSLLIAIVQLLRIFLEYIDRQMKSTKQGNAVVKVVMACLKCCMWCFEQIIKFLSKNAFIIVAMKGVSFCPAMKESFILLLNNALRVATVSIITRFLMIMGKLFIAGFSMFFLFLFIKSPPDNFPTFFMGNPKEIGSPVFPMLLTGLLAYAVASLFLDVYETGIDTILLCFCEDCKVNKASKNYYMSDELFAYIEGPAKKNAFRFYQPSRDASASQAASSHGDREYNPPEKAKPIFK